jgi:sodium/bile acid cotransporter 7
LSLLFRGSQKSLASGVPMADILFAGHTTCFIILPLMLYHQFQLPLRGHRPELCREGTQPSGNSGQGLTGCLDANPGWSELSLKP